jgi:hypothetical protein
MSIGEFTIGEAAVSEQPKGTGKTPPKRVYTATSDQPAVPEPR